MIDRIARHIVKQSAAKMWPLPAKNGPAPNVLRDIETAAVNWVSEAARHRLGEAPDSAMSERFAKWLQATAENAFFADKVAAAIVKGMANAVQFVATDPEAAKLIRCYADMERDHIPAFVPNPFNRPWDFASRYHQMLGNAGSTQTAQPVERDHILLLQLQSDNGVNFTFCGDGEAEFWINKHDLAARRFDRVFATTCGG
jgi:hypothetical protein